VAAPALKKKQEPDKGYAEQGNSKEVGYRKEALEKVPRMNEILVRVNTATVTVQNGQKTTG
jgi:hypothetical protein